MKQPLTGFIVLLCVFSAFAVPQQIHYQGQLTAGDGTPLDTTVAMTFAIHTSAAGNSAVWTETHAAVAVTGGSFQVALGQISPLTEDLFSGSERWLAIQIGADTEMAPRQQILSTAYAHRVGSVDGASGGTVTGDAHITGRLMAGPDNTNTGLHSFVAGQNNHVRAGYSSIGGGGSSEPADSNSVSGSFSHIGGGYHNLVTGRAAIVAGGHHNQITASEGAIGGGYYNTVSGVGSSVSGGVDNTASGINASVSGGWSNVASQTYAAVSGGSDNFASGYASVIGGGQQCSATAHTSSVLGGQSNVASASRAAVGGGYGNSATALSSSVTGGEQNLASGNYSAVAGGIDNQATATVSFAAGYRARAIHSGSFVWSSTGVGTEVTESFGVFTFTARCANGARFYTSQTGIGTGVQLAGGGGSWSSLSDSAQKENRRGVNTAEVLRKLMALDISEWNYKSQDARIRHMGPMAQDFSAAFGLGENNTTITTVDADGVMMASIQELAKRLDALEKRCDKLQSENAELRRAQAAQTKNRFASVVNE